MTAENLESAVAVAKESYLRCQRSPLFFQTFYDRFIAADPALPPMFAQTDFTRQHKFLEHALGLLLSFGRQRDPALLERLAHRHGPADLDIKRPMYDTWVWALLEAVRTHDPSWGPQVDRAWRQAIEPGIRFIAEHGR